MFWDDMSGAVKDIALATNSIRERGLIYYPSGDSLYSGLMGAVSLLYLPGWRELHCASPKRGFW